MCVFNCLDAVLDAVGRKTDIRLLKVFQAEIKPNRHEARIVVCLVRMLLLASVFLCEVFAVVFNYTVVS